MRERAGLAIKENIWNTTCSYSSSHRHCIWPCAYLEKKF